MTYKKSQIRKRVIGNTGTRAPTDKELKRIIYWAKEGRNPERNELIVFMQLNGFRITETATVNVEMLMWPSGLWRDEIIIPAKLCKNTKANHMLFVNKRLRKAANEYVEARLKRKHMITTDVKQYRGLKPDAPLVLAEGGKRYSLKIKRRTNIDGKSVDYWAADTLQEAFSTWCKNAGLGGELSSHCGRKALGSRLAKNKHTSQEDIIAVLLRHNEVGTIYHYVEESTGVTRTIINLYENL
jgi:hypothetical protein